MGPWNTVNELCMQCVAKLGLSQYLLIYMYAFFLPWTRHIGVKSILVEID